MEVSSNKRKCGARGVGNNQKDNDDIYIGYDENMFSVINELRESRQNTNRNPRPEKSNARTLREEVESELKHVHSSIKELK